MSEKFKILTVALVLVVVLLAVFAGSACATSANADDLTVQGRYGQQGQNYNGERQGLCDGDCDSTGQGNFYGNCSGDCDGVCDGDCDGTGQGNCYGDCDGDCDSAGNSGPWKNNKNIGRGACNGLCD